MSMREAPGRSFVPLASAWAVVGLSLFALAGPLAPCAARAQDDDEARVAERVHRDGAYPDDITVLEEESATDSASGVNGNGSGDGPDGQIHPSGDRDGGDAGRTLDLPFVRELLEALGRLLGAAASTLTYVLFALGISLLVVFVVFLFTLLRFPKRDLSLTRRDARPEGTAMQLDPLLEESLSSPEEYARQGRFREAIHALFVRSLKEVASSGDVDRRGRTAREVVAAIAKIQAGPPELADLLGLAELVWFGGRAATETQYVHAVDLAARIRASSGRPARGPDTSARPEAP